MRKKTSLNGAIEHSLDEVMEQTESEVEKLLSEMFETVEWRYNLKTMSEAELLESHRRKALRIVGLKGVRE